MSVYESLLGPELIDAKGNKYKTADKIQKTFVAIYCSAIWCAPCRKFTPLLMEVYNKLKQLGKNMEVIFSSWDSDSERFNDYFGKMPWLAIPYENSSFRENIKTKYGAKGIPTLIILGTNGELVNENARELVAEDPDCINYPWPSQRTIDILDRELNKDVSGEKVHGSILQGHMFGVYFSAFWCPSCKKFTPKLIKIYNKLKSENKDFEIVYISRDRDGEGYNDYYGEMPWLALPYGEDSTRDLLLAVNGVRFIPTLVLYNEKGERIRYDGRDALEAHPDGYPWIPPSLLYMHKSPEDINTKPCIILFSNDQSHKPILERISVERKKDDVSFILCNIEDGVSDQIRGLTHQTNNPLLMAIDIPQDGAYYVHEGDLTYEAMSDFVEKYYSGGIDRQQMG